ncbi:MAG: hypothetical protein F6K10_35885 [Moorea sp. SIO2B7]|nr:hypothetical protein [Moorena sp. SIO2B7]
MTQLITVTFDGHFLKPKNPLDLEVNKEYQIQLISEIHKAEQINDLDVSAQLYAEIYQEDLELQQLTDAACADFIE